MPFVSVKDMWELLEKTENDERADVAKAGDKQGTESKYTQYFHYLNLISDAVHKSLGLSTMVHT